MRLQIPKGVTRHIALTLVSAILLLLLGNLALHRWENEEHPDAPPHEWVVRQLVHATHIAETTQPKHRATLIHGFGTEQLELNWVPGTVITDQSKTLMQLASMHKRIVDAVPELEDQKLRVNLILTANGRQRDLIGRIELEDGSFISFRVRPFLRAPIPLWLISLLNTTLLIIIFGIVFLLVQKLVRSLQELESAANNARRDQALAIVPSGPPDVRRLATALSRMHARLLTAIDENAQALIAVSHDLRTPIQRIKLRMSNFDHSEVCKAIEQDLVTIEKFIDSTMTYARSGKDEVPRLVDVVTILSTIVDDTADSGIDIRYHGPDSFILFVRPLSLTRMIQNLIDNATHHAGKIVVTLSCTNGSQAQISVDDNGPGIPKEKRTLAVQPFSRFPNRQQTGNIDNPVDGAGLGLAFIQRILEEQGGQLSLETSPLGGLRACITLSDNRPPD